MQRRKAWGARRRRAARSCTERSATRGSPVFSWRNAIVSIIATILSRCEISQRASAYSTQATTAAQTTVVVTPNSIEPPKASASESTDTPASRLSKHSIAGTATIAPSTVAATKAIRSPPESCACGTRWR
ncbi:MAG TPA: hypothetical protein VHX17_13975 [Candidatus Cybelea sp.]|nr:hypothetical protein [Candidatus Cybelea sp.]